MSGPACLYMFDDNRRKVMCYCIIILHPRQVSLFPFSNTQLLLWALLEWFFPPPHPSLVSHWGLSPRTQLAPQPCISHHHDLFLPFLIIYLFKNRLFVHIKLALDGCIIFNMPLLPSCRWPHLHEVKDANLKNTKQVLQNEPESEIKP